jgi:TolB-like protein/DNA-binding winged helix-turn-helix (wHTH) protein/Flp pilus assembly protein TadD
MNTPRADVIFWFEDFEVDAAAGELRRNGRRIKLQEQPWRVLLVLLERAGQVVTREELRTRLWPSDTFVDFDHSLNIAIAKIRDVLDDSPANPRFVSTVPRRGYRFHAPVERRVAPEAEEAPAPPAPVAQPEPTSHSRGLLVAGLAAIVIAATAAWLFARKPTTPHAIAVLPLRNLDSRPDTDYFGDGLTGELIYNLSRVEGLEVKSRASSSMLKGASMSAHDAGVRLGADLILEGAVFRDGDHLRLNVTLVRAADDVTLWAQRYDRTLRDVFEVEDEISRTVVNELRLKGVGGARKYPASLAAYDLYLRAESLDNETAPSRDLEARLGQAVALLQQAIEKDSEFAPAYAAEADAYAHMRNRGRSAETTPLMRAAAQRAIELDPLLPDAYASIGVAEASALHWREAESAFRRALSLDPNRSRAREDFAMFVLQPQGENTEAIAQFRRALELDPLTDSRRTALAFGLIRSGENQEALTILWGLLARNPGDGLASQFEARALLAMGRDTEALAILEKLGPAAHGYLGYAYAKVGRIADAEAIAAEPDPAAARHQALTYAGLGDAARCIAALKAIAGANDYMADLLPGEPELAALRNDPEMREFRRARGLPAAPPN